MVRDFGIDTESIRRGDLTPWDKAAELEALARARDDDNFWRENMQALLRATGRRYQEALDLYNRLTIECPSPDQRAEQLRLHLIAKGMLSADDARRIPAQPPITSEQSAAMIEAERERARLQAEIDKTLQPLSLDDRQTAQGIYNAMRQERSMDKIHEWRQLLKQRGIHPTKVLSPMERK